LKQFAFRLCSARILCGMASIETGQFAMDAKSPSDVKTLRGHIQCNTMLFFLIFGYFRQNVLCLNLVEIYQLLFPNVLPGLHEDSDQTAWFPTSRSSPSFSSLKTSSFLLAVTFVAITDDLTAEISSV